MRCFVCDGTEWTNVDKYRMKPHGMSMCNGCGVVSYPKKYKTEEEIKAHYRTGYRPAPNAMNLFSGERKLYYHEVLLAPLLEEWKKAGVKPVIGEIGAAMGLFLSWIRHKVPGCQVSGTELTTSFRRVAFHEFGIELTEEFDFSKKYDLIASYHVLEHQTDPDIWLRRYAEALSPSGVLYLSTPIWFREATNFGQAGFDLEYYWAPDHINCWSEEHLEQVIRRAGLAILHKNDNIYGNTYILKQDDQIKPIDKLWDVNAYENTMEKMITCWKAIEENDTALAIATYPNCPKAWVHHYELERGRFHKDSAALASFLEQAIAACPNTADTLTMAGDIYTRYEKFQEAYKLFERALRRKPNNPTILMAMSNCIRQTALREKDEKERIVLLKEALRILERVRETSVELSNQATSWMYHDQSLIPMENETK